MKEMVDRFREEYTTRFENANNGIDASAQEINNIILQLQSVAQSLCYKSDRTYSAHQSTLNAACDYIEELADKDAQIESLTAQLAQKEKELSNARNELCYKCGRYAEAHLGACDGCRWKIGKDGQK